MPSDAPPAAPRFLPPGPALPALPPSVPRRRYPPGVSALGRGILRLFGWRYAGGFSDAPAQILIGAPHTSNWDAVLALSAAAGCGIGVDRFCMFLCNQPSIRDVLFFPLMRRENT